MFVWIILMMFCVFLDQITKYLVVIYMDLHESISIIPGIFNFTYIRNEGAAFGSMSDSRWIFMILSTVAIVALLVYLFVKKPQSKLFCTALSLIVGGGIGNMIDRVRLGYVVDFLDFCAFPKVWMWTFNVADSFVCVGAGLLILWMILDLIKENKREKQMQANTSECVDTEISENLDSEASDSRTDDGENNFESEKNGNAEQIIASDCKNTDSDENKDTHTNIPDDGQESGISKLDNNCTTDGSGTDIETDKDE